MTAAAFKATYSDWKLIRTRKVVQIVFEVPVESAGLAYEVLGGMPRPDSEVWCAVARLDPTKESAAQPRPSPTTAPTSTGGAHHKSFHEMSAAQQAGILCNEPRFAKFLMERRRSHWSVAAEATETPERAAVAVRDICVVKSRAEIDKNEGATFRWRTLVSDYRAWIQELAVVA